MRHCEAFCGEAISECWLRRLETAAALPLL